MILIVALIIFIEKHVTAFCFIIVEKISSESHTVWPTKEKSLTLASGLIFFMKHYFCCKKRDNSLLSHCDFLSLRHWWSIFVAILLTCIELQSPLITYRMQCLYRWCVSWLVFTRSVCFNSFSPATTAIITSVKRFQFLVCIY